MTVAQSFHSFLRYGSELELRRKAKELHQELRQYRNVRSLKRDLAAERLRAIRHVLSVQ